MDSDLTHKNQLSLIPLSDFNEININESKKIKNEFLDTFYLNSNFTNVTGYTTSSDMKIGNLNINSSSKLIKKPTSQGKQQNTDNIISSFQVKHRMLKPYQPEQFNILLKTPKQGSQRRNLQTETQEKSYSQCQNNLSVNRLLFSSYVKSKQHQLYHTEILTVDEERQLQHDVPVEQYAKTISPFEDNANQLYSKIYKNLDKVVESKQFYNTTTDSIYTAMLSKTQKSDFRKQKELSSTKQLQQNLIRKIGEQKCFPKPTTQLLPKKFGLIGSSHLGKQVNVFNAGHFQMGDRYANMLSAGLASESMQNLQSITLRNNRLTATGAQQVVRSLSKQVKKLNLEGNRVGQIHLKNTDLLQSFNRQFKNIVDLNLENNKFRDEAAILLFKELCTNHRIRKLNLSQNYIGDQSSSMLQEFLITNKYVTEFSLHWNWLHSQCGISIAKALLQNDVIKILDLSYNSIGLDYSSKFTKKSSKNSQHSTCACALEWSEYLGSENCSLVHLDLSYNQFNLSDSTMISTKLENNHTLYGFHFKGNSNSYIDHKGFLICQNEDQQTVQQSVGKFLISNVSDHNENSQHNYTPGILKHKRIQGANQLQNYDIENCWICCGWTEVEIIWQPSPLELQKEPIFVHFSHERYVPVSMIKQNDNYQRWGQTPMSRKVSTNKRKLWSVKRMIPSGQQIKFFFSGPLIKTSTFSRQYPRDTWNEEERKKKVVFYTKLGEMLKFRRPKYCNTIQVQVKPILEEIQSNGSFNALIESVPRLKDLGGVLDFRLDEIELQSDEEETYENFFIDCFRETPEQYNDCFEYDWSRSSINKFIKAEESKSQVKEYLRGIYCDIVSAYRVISTYSPCGDVWSISLNCYTDIFAPSLVDNKYGLKDLDIIFKQCTSKHNNVTRATTQSALIRFQFMEILTRLAIDKYYRSGICQTQVEALQKMYVEDGLAKRIEALQDPQEWREQFYWTPQCNKIAIEYTPVLQQLFTIGVGLRQLNYFTIQKFMTPSSFRELLQRAKLIDEQNVERNVNLAFNQSLPLVIDEIDSDRHMQMNFKEFVEALARVSEKIPFQQKAEDSRQVQVANKLQKLIQSLAKIYEIPFPDNDKEKSAQQQLKKRESQKREVTTFIASRGNQLVFEADETPIQQFQVKSFNLSSFSTAVQGL